MEMQVLAHVLCVTLGIVELTVTHQTHALRLMIPRMTAAVVFLDPKVDFTVLMVEQ